MTPKRTAIDGAKGILTAVLAASSLSLVLPGLGYDVGIWPQTEIVSSALPVLVGFAAIIVFLIAFLQDKRTLGALTSPITQILLLTAGASALMAGFLPDPSVSIFGLNKHGIGGFWFAQIAILAVSYATLSRLAKQLVSTAVLIAFLICFATYVLSGLIPLGPALSFAEWVGLLAAATSAVILWPTQSRSTNPASYIVAALVLSLGLYVSENRAVLLTIIAIPMIAIVARIAPSLFSTGARRGSFVAAISLVGFIVMYSAAPIIETTATITPRADRVLSEDVLDRAALSKGVLGTIWSRSYMSRVVVDEMLANPSDLIVGRGWGFFPELYEEIARDVPGRMYRVSNPASSNTYWDVHGKANFHSHNMFAESLGALGILGPILWCGILWAIAAASMRGLFIASGLAILGTFWFPLNVMTPAIAFAIGTVIRPRRAGLAASPMLPMIGAIGLLCIFSGKMAFDLAVSEHYERYFARVLNPVEGNCRALSAGLLPESDVHADLMITLQKRILSSDDPISTMIKHRSNIESLSCALRLAAEEDGNVRSLAVLLDTRAKLVSIGGPAAIILKDEISRWPGDLKLWFDLAPARSELVVPLITHLSTTNPTEAIMRASIYESVLDEGDPIKSWLKAFLNGAAGREEARAKLLRQSLSEGFADIYKVDRTTLKELGL